MVATPASSFSPAQGLARRTQGGTQRAGAIKEEEKTLYADMTPDELDEVVDFHACYAEYQAMMEALLG